MRRAMAWALAAVVTFAAVAWQIQAGVRLSDGVFAYPLDDTYIHLAVAKNFATLGVWGVNPADPTSASSSPLWTLALAAVGFLGVSFAYLPLALNLLAALGLLIAADEFLKDAGLPPLVRGGALLVLSAVAPLPSLIVIGMEHTLQAAMCVLYLLALRRSAHARWRRIAVITAAMMPLVRFETLAVVLFGACSQWRISRSYALTLLGAGLAAVALFAVLSVALGWAWLPNSVLIKGAYSRTIDLWFAQVGENLRLYRELTWLAAAVAALAMLRLVADTCRRDALIAVGAMAVHTLAAPPNDQVRYEVYVEVLLILTFAAVWWNAATRWMAVGPIARMSAAAGLVLAAGLSVLDALPRVVRPFTHTPLAMRNIADQQGQTVRFIRDYLTVEGSVVVSDIGWVAYASHRPVVDFLGLGDSVVAAARINGGYNAHLLEARANAQGATVAVLQALPNRPSSWIPVAEARILDNVACGSDTVVIFATTAAAADPIRRDFERFAKTLPRRTVTRLLAGDGSVR